MKLQPRKRYAYHVLIFLIGLISVYDSECLVLHRNDLVEENPVGRFLIRLANGEVYLFVNIKAVSTIFCVITCFVLLKTKYRSAIIGVFLFQLWLFLYLTWG